LFKRQVFPEFVFHSFFMRSRIVQLLQAFPILFLLHVIISSYDLKMLSLAPYPYILIVAFLTFGTTHHFNRHILDLTVFNVIMQFLEDAVVVVFSELYIGCTVAVDTPAHRKVSELMHLVHVLD